MYFTTIVISSFLMVSNVVESVIFTDCGTKSAAIKQLSVNECEADQDECRFVIGTNATLQATIVPSKRKTEGVIWVWR